MNYKSFSYTEASDAFARHVEELHFPRLHLHSKKTMPAAIIIALAIFAAGYMSLQKYNSIKAQENAMPSLIKAAYNTEPDNVIYSTGAYGK